MAIHLEQIKTNDKFHEKKCSEFVKTCDEFVIGPRSRRHPWCHSKCSQLGWSQYVQANFRIYSRTCN